MTAETFRRLALSFPEAAEGAHMGHADFRVGGKIFATLGHPNDEWGVVKLSPDQQKAFVGADPDAFAPVDGGWGRRGYTRVRLRSADGSSVRDALEQAWRNTAPKRLVRQAETVRPRRAAGS